MQIDLAPDPSLLAIMAIFLLNCLVVSRFFLKPINQLLDARERETRTADQLYEESLARFNEATSAMEEQLHAAKRDASQVRDRFRADAAARRAQLIERTQGEAKSAIAQAEEKMQRDVGEARETIKRQSEELARFAAERILGRPV